MTFIGVKNHPDEQNNRMVIIKHRPSLKLEFYSPLQSSEKVKLFEDLTPQEQEEENLYREFIKRKEARTIDNLALVFFVLVRFVLLYNIYILNLHMLLLVGSIKIEDSLEL